MLHNEAKTKEVLHEKRGANQSSQEPWIDASRYGSSSWCSQKLLWAYRKWNPTLKIAAKIATALNSSIEQLFPDEIFFANKCYEMKL